MRRLSIFMKNKTELMGSATQLGAGVMYPDSIEKSGLSPTEIFHLEQWVAGTAFFFSRLFKMLSVCSCVFILIILHCIFHFRS
jgi:hypothetical protein